MPELPDLEVFAKNLDKRVRGKRVKNVEVFKPKKLDVSQEAFKKVVEGQEINKVFRNGKEIWMGFEKGQTVAFHLMLRGQFSLPEKEEEGKYGILAFHLEDGKRLLFADPRGMGKVMLNPGENDAVDGLSKKLTPDFLKEKLAKKKGGIKNFLLDQNEIKGIGNAYADEILWEARISPFSGCDKIPEKKVEELAAAIPKVLREAIYHIDKNHLGIMGGEVREFLNIHQKKRKTSPGGAEIQTKKSGSRTTYFTSEQKLYD
jgi:formamidopyrimidine-DNA glycosylase